MRFKILIAAIIASSSIASAEDSQKLRRATVDEIRQALKGTANLKDGGDGYQYLPGKSVGYRISKGSICTKQSTGAYCVTIMTDGTTLQMIDRQGNREKLN